MESRKTVSYLFQNIGIFLIILAIFPFIPRPVEILGYVLGCGALLFRWKVFKIKPDFLGCIYWKPIIGMLSFIAILLLISIFSLDTHKSIHIVLNYLKYMKPFFAVVLFLNSNINFYRAIAYGLLIGIMGLCLGPDNFAYQYFILHRDVDELTKLYTIHRNTIADLLAFTLPVYFWYFLTKTCHKAEKGIWLMAVIIQIINLLAVQSRGAILALVITGIIFGFVYLMRSNVPKSIIFKIICSVVVCFAIAFIFVPKDNHIFDIDNAVQINTQNVAQYSEKDRIYLYEGALHMIEDRPIFGVGLGNFENEYTQYYMVPGAREKNLPHAHNLVLALLTSTGIIGFSTFLVMTFGFIRIFLKNRCNNPTTMMAFACMTIFFLHNMVDYFFGQFLIAPVYWCVLVIAYSSVCLNMSNLPDAKERF
jgi:O-antigen ligase